MSTRALAFLVLQDHCMALWFGRTTKGRLARGQGVRNRLIAEARQRAWRSLSTDEQKLVRAVETVKP
jgi:hypothetical protein